MTFPAFLHTLDRTAFYGFNMKERLSRLQTIKKLLKTNRIHSQEELLKKMEDEGLPITPATLSRDLRLLKVAKVSGADGVYAYVLPEEESPVQNADTFAEDFARGCAGIECSGNLLVIRTCAGYANIVAHALDKMNFAEILGTVSGRDNCVFACLREGVQGKTFLSILKAKIPALDI